LEPIFHGFYFGGHVGGASHDWSWTDRDDWVGEADPNGGLPHFVSGTDSGIAGGVQGGFNWQRGCTVLGFEADWNWADLNSSKLFTDGNVGNADTLRVSSNIDGFGTLRTRTGVVVDSLLLYVTGGLAFADIERRATLFDADARADDLETFAFSDTRFGLAAGLGAEWAVTNLISLKTEALWLRFEEDGHTRLCNIDICGTNEPKRFDLQDDVFTARIGLNFKFGRF
jgi:outer membrane immunogenic protein